MAGLQPKGYTQAPSRSPMSWIWAWDSSGQARGCFFPLFILDEGEWEAMGYQWAPAMHQCVRWRGAEQVQGYNSHVRAVPTTLAMPIIQLLLDVHVGGCLVATLCSWPGTWSVKSLLAAPSSPSAGPWCSLLWVCQMTRPWTSCIGGVSQMPAGRT